MILNLVLGKLQKKQINQFSTKNIINLSLNTKTNKNFLTANNKKKLFST